MERKTQTSTEVKARYNAKAYKRYTLNLRTDTDTDLIAQIETAQSRGISPSEIIKQMIRK